MFTTVPTFLQNGKFCTVDPRLQGFRHVVYGELPEFVPFESEEGGGTNGSAETSKRDQSLSIELNYHMLVVTSS